MLDIDFKQYKLLTHKSPEDHRDFITTAIIPQDIILPSKFSLKDKIKITLDQKQYGICAGCAGADMKNVQEVVDSNVPNNGFSPVYLYTLAKQIDGIPNVEGTYPRSIMQVLSNKGALPYNEMPISVLDTLGGKLPTITQDQINKSMPSKIASYAQVPKDINISALKQAMVSTQSPVIMGIAVSNSFYYPEQRKYVAKPVGTMYGGHAITVVSYDDNMTFTYQDGTTEVGFIEIHTSWSSNWANEGFAYIPYSAMNWVFGNNQWPFIFEMWSSIDEHSDAPQPEKPKYWRINTGSFLVKTNAQNYQIQLK